MIPAGTRCHLLGLVEAAHHNGRVVEIVGHEIGRDGTLWHLVDAPWIEEVARGGDVQVREDNLRPIASAIN